jgi:acid stress-induced BolA-like protein IbaG/YrbA
MKRLSLFAIVATLFAIFSVASAQETTQQEMKYDDWQAQMTGLTTQRDSLKTVLGRVDSDIVNLKTQLAGLDQQYQSETQKYLGMVGVTQSDMTAFDQALTALAGQIDNYNKMSDQDLCAHQAEVKAVGTQIDSVKASKPALAAEFYSRVQDLANGYAQLQTRIANCSQMAMEMKTYTVGTWARNRDCLWNISKKPKIYDDPWKWPKIYVANRDQIKNPDLIYPREVLKIPENGPLNSEENAAAKAYYAKKARMSKSSAGE